MANRIVMRAQAMAREGRSMKDIRLWLDCQQQSPAFVRDEAEARAETTFARHEERAAEAGRVKAQKLPRKKRARFPFRGERRNAMHGRKASGNTKPHERQRTEFVYHPSSLQARAQLRSKAEAEQRRQEREANVAAVMEHVTVKAVHAAVAKAVRMVSNEVIGRIGRAKVTTTTTNRTNRKAGRGR